ncbi:polysaccharide biosynthesis/export family protein [Hyphomicrobium sp. D-2]|uniref:polysaccharide biosynthesis/export family protein n=1 Tax=Hyphomicrobium sp. D-2 TaxID=3041621 RepID=UPI0024557B96|nr:polysaccharide biosynthesis/export family protein [Hyphomicrobium sp. D-2]MDH4980687.1 polysaccharide export protein [Hyphomicrobium sp. D-2]
MTVFLLAGVLAAGCGASMGDGATASLGGDVSPQSVSASFADPSGGSTMGSPTLSGAPVRVDGVDRLMASATPGSHGYKVGPQDVLEISVFKVPELSRSVQVADAGSINLPLVGEVDAAGKTARDLEQELTQKLGDKYLQSPQVTVFVKEYNSRRVTIEGAVKKPGVYPIRDRTSLLQFISIAEGVTELADSEIVVFRQSGGQKSVARFDIDDIRGGKTADPDIRDGDLIVVNTSSTKTVYQNLLRILPSTASFLLLL